MWQIVSVTRLLDAGFKMDFDIKKGMRMIKDGESYPIIRRGPLMFLKAQRRLGAEGKRPKQSDLLCYCDATGKDSAEYVGPVTRSDKDHWNSRRMW